jgi:glycosyltransferase 2 family protein
MFCDWLGFSNFLFNFQGHGMKIDSECLDSPEKKDLSEHHFHRHFLGGWRFKAMIATICISVIGYILFILWGGWEQVSEAVARVGIWGILLALALSLVNYWLRFLRWQCFLRILGHRVPTFLSLRIYIAGFSLTTTPGKTGEALRSIFLKDHGIAYRQSFGAFLSERLSDLIAVVILASSGLWKYPETRPIVIIVGIVIVFVLFAVQKNSWLKFGEKMALKILPNRFAHIVEFFIETILAFRSCFAPRALIYGIIFGVLAWGSEGLAFYYLLGFLGYNISILTAMFIYGFSLLIGAITFLPGGLGGAEVTMLQLLIMNNVTTFDAVAATIVIRLTTLWFSVILGLLFLPKKQITLHHQ